MFLQELREQVLETALQMQADGLAHLSQGNVSARDAQTGLIAIKPSAVPYNRMKAKDICVVDLDGRQLRGYWKPTSEMALHLAFYRRRADVMAVVHSHAPYSSVFGIANTPIPMVLTESAACLGAEVPIAPYRRPGTQELADVTVETAGDGRAVFMAHHGLVTVGSTLAQAYEATLAVETTARVIIMARSMGLNEIHLDPAEVQAVYSIYTSGYRPKPA